MLPTPVLFSGFLLVSAVLAVLPLRDGAFMARRLEGRLSQFNDRLEEPVQSDISNSVVYSSNWAGALWDMPNGTFNAVTGTFTVPLPGGGNGTAASVWVGIDGDTCTSAILQTGIDFTISGGYIWYDAWYEWYPEYAQYFSGIDIAPGDVMKLTVVASSSTTGTATIENLSNGQAVSQSLSSNAALCGKNAEWIVEDFQQSGQLVPFADFGIVTFTNAEATGAVEYTPSGATTVNMKQSGQIVTSVSIDGSSVTVKYV